MNPYKVPNGSGLSKDETVVVMTGLLQPMLTLSLGVLEMMTAYKEGSMEQLRTGKASGFGMFLK